MQRMDLRIWQLREIRSLTGFAGTSWAQAFWSKHMFSQWIGKVWRSGMLAFGSGMEKQPKHGVFGRDIPRISGRTSRPQNVHPIARSAGKYSFWSGRPWPEGADVHELRGSQKNLTQENFGLMFRSLYRCSTPTPKQLCSPPSFETFWTLLVWLHPALEKTKHQPCKQTIWMLSAVGGGRTPTANRYREIERERDKDRKIERYIYIERERERQIRKDRERERDKNPPPKKKEIESESEREKQQQAK